MLRGAYKKTKRWEALASSYSLGDHSDAHSLYSVIDEKMPEYRQVGAGGTETNPKMFLVFAFPCKPLGK